MLPKLSIIVSVYNEEKSLPLFYKELEQELQRVEALAEIIFVNDGSKDQSLNILKEFASHNSAIRVINFSRNFGHEAAMIAGIDHCTGDLAICMDADLQHPPKYIAEMLKKWQEGNDIVLMVRNDRKDGGFFRNITSKMFYNITNKLLNTKLEPNASDFFMVSRRIMNLLKSDYRERTRFVRGFIQIVGFNKTTIEYVAPSRIAGESKYSFFKLLTLSFSAISTLSKVPLKLGLWCGLVSGLFSIIVAIYSLVMWTIEKPIPGYTTLIIFLSLMFCINFIVIGIIGEYIGHLFDEAKNRPVYLVKSIVEANNSNP
jgi:dolichol-phosphate mannosyltransferase